MLYIQHLLGVPFFSVFTWEPFSAIITHREMIFEFNSSDYVICVQRETVGVYCLFSDCLFILYTQPHRI